MHDIDDLIDFSFVKAQEVFCARYKAAFNSFSLSKQIVHDRYEVTVPDNEKIADGPNKLAKIFFEFLSAHTDTSLTLLKSVITQEVMFLTAMPEYWVRLENKKHTMETRDIRECVKIDHTEARLLLRLDAVLSIAALKIDKKKQKTP